MKCHFEHTATYCKITITMNTNFVLNVYSSSTRHDDQAPMSDVNSKTLHTDMSPWPSTSHHHSSERIQ